MLPTDRRIFSTGYNEGELKRLYRNRLDLNQELSRFHHTRYDEPSINIRVKQNLRDSRRADCEGTSFSKSCGGNWLLPEDLQPTGSVPQEDCDIG